MGRLFRRAVKGRRRRSRSSAVPCEIAPQQASARQQYGLNLVVLGRNEDAKRELSEAVRLDPRDVDSLAHLTYHAEIQLGQEDDALRHVRAALALQPDHALTRQLRGGPANRVRGGSNL